MSPDGKTLAFSYQGDIWTVASAGGTAARLTVHEAPDQLPSWSPNGQWIAYSSRREGNNDVWLIPAKGGTPRQLTFHSADDSVTGWSPDGADVLFSSGRETTRTSAIHAVSVATGKSRLIREDDVALANAQVSPDGTWLACTRGGSWSRKGYRGSGRSSLLILPSSGGAGRWLVRDEANQRWPMFAPDGRAVYYVSDAGGTANIVKRGVSGGAEQRITHHTDGMVTYPTLARDGSRIVYEQGFRLWSVDLTQRRPAKEVVLNVTAPSDERSNAVTRSTFTTGVQEMALSPDGKQMAFVIHGEVFVQPVPAAGEATRLTDTPQREEDIAWSPDGKRLALISDRTGNGELYALDVATRKVTQLTTTAGVSESSPRWSPDGKQIAFLRGGEGQELCAVSAEGGQTRVLVHDPVVGAPEWSPDGKWIAYFRMKSHSAGVVSDIFIVNAADPKPVNVTRWAVVNLNPQWSSDGRTLFFLSSRTTKTHVYSVALQDPRGRDDDESPDSAPAPRPPTGRNPVEVKIDAEDIHKRAKQITTGEDGVSEYAVSPDGKSVVFAMAQLGKTDIWRTAASGGAPTRLTQSGESGSQMRFGPDGSTVWYRAGGGIRTLALSGPAPVPVPVAVTARMVIDTRLELLQMFDEAWRKMRELFYDDKMHGCDWAALRERYRPVVENLATKDEFYALFALALGELNASHTGVSGSRGDAGGASTPSLGVEFDDAYPGPGLKVKSVMPKGPADTDRSRLRIGDIVLKADGEPVTVNESLHALLADRAGKRVPFVVSTPGGKPEERTVTLRLITGAAYKALEYDRWIKEREVQVDKLSNGRLRYVHLAGMGAANLEVFKRTALSDMEGKDGLILDLRFNGGGSIADEIFSILGNRVFGYRTIRGDPAMLPAPMPAFAKPVIVLANEASFSNAEVFPWGFRALKLGKVVGVPTYGGVIGTGSTNLIDGSTMRVPAVGSYTMDGQNMENNGCPPDVLVEPSPADIVAKQDRQLERAVRELLGDLPKPKSIPPPVR